MNAMLELKDIGAAYDGKAVVGGVGFELNKGEIGCLLGPSGCGKTTVLRAIAGLEPVTSGKVYINGLVMSAPGRIVSPEKRRVGMVFQDYALFPHLRAGKNVSFGLHGLSSAEVKKRVVEMIKAVGLDGLEDRYPHELSGGQQQRLALARALAPRPDLILMDEPFSNLDVTLREKVSRQVREILKRYETTALIVTHNHLEAFAISDRIGVLSNGRLEQWDTAHNIYHLPESAFVADFIGEGSFIKGLVEGKDVVNTALGKLSGHFSSPCEGGCYVEVLIRPDDVLHDDESTVKARVVEKNFRGASILYSLELENGERVPSLAPSHHNHEIGQLIGIRTEVDDIVLFTADPELCKEKLCRVL
jgi:iron(III) transport system ATP-binding protein